MAAAVEFRTFQPVDLREDLLRKVADAPAKHAEAVLAAYDLLERLHEKDVLSLLSGMLAAKDTLIDHAAGLVSSREMVNVLRLSLIAGKMLDKIDPDALSSVLHEAEGDPPSFWTIARRMTSKDARRAMGLFGAILNLFGSAIAKT